MKIIKLNSIEQENIGKIPDIILDIEHALIKYYGPSLNGNAKHFRKTNIIDIEDALNLLKLHYKNEPKIIPIEKYIFKNIYLYIV